MKILTSPDTLNKFIDPMAQKFSPTAKDDKFGLYWNKNAATLADVDLLAKYLQNVTSHWTNILI